MGIKDAISNFFNLKNDECKSENEEVAKQNFYCDSDFIKSLLSQIHDLKVNDKLARKDIKSLREILIGMQVFIAILIAVIGVVIPLVFSVHSNAIDNSIKAYTGETTAKFELIQQQLNSQKENNSMQIQRDVAMEVKKQNH